MNIEVVKEKLASAHTRLANVLNEPGHGAIDVDVVADALADIDVAKALLDNMADPAEVAKLVAHHQERRHGARKRAKLEVQHSLRSRIEQLADVPHPNGNTWRDGYVRGLEDGHATAAALSDVDPEV